MKDVSVTANLYNKGNLLSTLTVFADDAKEGIKKIREAASGCYFMITAIKGEDVKS